MKTLQGLAGRYSGVGVDIRLAVLDGSRQPDWDVLGTPPEERPDVLHRLRTSNASWLVGFVETLVKNDFVSIEDGRRIQREILDLCDRL